MGVGVQIFHGALVDVCPNTVTIELTGKEDKMHALQDVLEPYGEGQARGERHRARNTGREGQVVVAVCVCAQGGWGGWRVRGN